MAIGIGETLRAARCEQGLSLSDAAGATRIRERYLSALEDDEFEVLGEDVYVRGFLRNYARYLGLDPGPLLAEYGASFRPPPDDPPVSAAPALRQGVPVPPAVRTVAAAGTLVLLLAVVAVAGDRGDGTPAEPVTPQPTTTAAADGVETPAPATPPAVPTTAPAPPATAPPATATTEPPPAPGVEVAVRVRGGPSWIRVVVDGTTELESTLQDGDTRVFHGEERIVLRVGDAANVHLTVGGEESGPLGPPGAVVDLEFPAG